MGLPCSKGRGLFSDAVCGGLSRPCGFVPLSYSLCLLVTVDSSAVLEDEAVGFSFGRRPGERNQNCQSKGSRNTRCSKKPVVCSGGTRACRAGSRAGCWLCLEVCPEAQGPAWPQGSGRLGVWLGWARTWALGPRSRPMPLIFLSLLGEKPPVFSFPYILGSQRTVSEAL